MILTEQFEVVKHSAKARIPQDLWNMMVEANEVEDFVGNWIEITCSWESASKTSMGELEVPANWLEHTKERFAPKWLRARWPVRTARYRARWFYPAIEVPTAKLRQSFPTFEVSHLPDGSTDQRVRGES